MSNTLITKENTAFSRYVEWLKEISWGRFVLFFLLTCMISNMIENIFNLYYENLLSDFTVLFLLISLGLKGLSPEKKKSEISLTKNE